MESPKNVLITGAAGSLGTKLRRHLHGRFSLCLLDKDPRGDADIIPCDLAHWHTSWVDRFQGVDVGFHFAGNPEAFHSWPELTGPNLDGMIHAYHAAIRGGVRRFIFASSNHVMGGYHDVPGVRLTADTPPRPGLRYVVDGETRDSTAYACAKLFGERMGRCCAESSGLEVIAVRLGWVYRKGPNLAANLPRERGDWFRLMWLSDPDFCQLMERCILAELPSRFLLVNGMSSNTGMAWDLADTRRILGYEPQDDVTR
jgi:nucleoside-diphosphate-sugar epimerase